MRDYKNVKVPRSYRGESNRRTVKRVQVTRSGRSGERKGSGLLVLLQKVLAVLVSAAAVALCWEGYRTLTTSDLFVVSGVDIKGVHHLSQGDLAGVASVFSGQNIFRVDVDAAVQRARANPWVKEVRVHRRLPNRITMVVEERVPAYLLETGAGRYVMDNEGSILERAPQNDGHPWPLPVVAINCRVRIGEQLATEGLAEAMLLLEEIAARGGWRPADVTVKAASPEALSIVYADHEFRIGQGRYGEKLRRLSEILADVKQRGIDIAYVDLRAERLAAGMVKKEKGQGGGARGQGRKKPA